MTYITDFFVADLQQAIKTNNREAMRTILDLMRRRNVGEALVPGLRELCKQARQILTPGANGA